ncbi:MAG: hypothetical protein HY293_03070 [Planctomycetes bacterium]|nr:hypothetical protein [Planctomycetota bacterium]
MLAPAAQADYWASRLVEARALDWRGRTCFCDGFLEKDAVADALLALGRTAIPALLQRLGQSRLTRMVEIEHSSHSIDLRPWTVHEAAEHLLRKIVGFYAGRSNEPEKAAGGWWAWWSRAREQDEKTWWREWIEGDGDRSRSGALHRLVEADGDQAAPWVLIALEKGESFDLFDVLQAARQIPSEAVVPSLRALLHRQSRDAFIVAETADALAQHGDASGLDHLRAEVLRVRDGASDAWAMKQYLQALAGSGREEDFALALETACGESSSTESRRGAFEALSWATSLGHLANKPIATPELFHQAGSVVAGRLGDRRPSGDYSLPRFCDQAASLLRQWFPGKAVFKYDAPAPERNRQIREMQKWAEGFFD